MQTAFWQVPLSQVTSAQGSGFGSQLSQPEAMTRAKIAKSFVFMVLSVSSPLTKVAGGLGLLQVRDAAEEFRLFTRAIRAHPLLVGGWSWAKVALVNVKWLIRKECLVVKDQPLAFPTVSGGKRHGRDK